jgi:hypothetical protein
MTRSGLGRLLSVAAAMTLLAACGGSNTPTATPAGGGGGTSGPGATSQSAGGGDVSSIKACSLLTPAEIQSALGAAMKDGLEQDTDGQVECNWDPQNDTEATAVSVSVARYDDTLWQTISQAQGATPVSGFGEAAFSGFPHDGDLSIKKDGFQIDIGIVYFGTDQAKVKAADATFANLVLSRL